MKFRVTMKDPDTLYDAINEAVSEWAMSLEGLSVAETMDKRRREMEAEKQAASEAPCSPAERAVINAAVAWSASTGTEATLTLRDRVEELHAAVKANAKGKVQP